MKTTGILLLLGALLSLSAARNVSGADCKEIARYVRAEIEKDVSNTLTVVEDSLVANGDCAGEIVRAAIEASRADAGLVKKIVFIAVKTSPQEAPAIAESAVAAAPSHADTVRAAFAEAFENQSPAKPPAKKSTPAKPAQVASKTGPASPSANQNRPVPPKSAAKKADAPSHRPATESVGGKEVVSGKRVVEAAPSYAWETDGDPSADGNGNGNRNGNGDWSEYGDGEEFVSFFGGPPIDITGIYLIPPVATAPPFIEEEDPEDDEPRVTRSPRRRSPQRRPPVIVSVPMSPTAP